MKAFPKTTIVQVVKFTRELPSTCHQPTLAWVTESYSTENLKNEEKMYKD